MGFLTGGPCPFVMLPLEPGENFPVTWRNEPHELAWLITFICMLIAVAVSVWLAVMHLLHFTRPREQRQIVRILFMVPIFSVCSWFAFRFYQSAVFPDLINQCYEAFAIYSFYCLLLAYCDRVNIEGAEGVFGEMKDSTRKCIPPMCCIRYKVKDSLFLHLKWGTLQYVIVRPVTTILAVILEVAGMRDGLASHYCDGVWNVNYGFLYLTIINSLSVGVAMLALLTFYVLTRDKLSHAQVGDKKLKTVWKFVGVKLVVFMSFWEKILVAILQAGGLIHGTMYWTPVNVAEGIQDTLICCEMMLLSFFFVYAFSYKPYVLHRGDSDKLVDVIEKSRKHHHRDDNQQGDQDGGAGVEGRRRSRRLEPVVRGDTPPLDNSTAAILPRQLSAARRGKRLADVEMGVVVDTGQPDGEAAHAVDHDDEDDKRVVYSNCCRSCLKVITFSDWAKDMAVLAKNPVLKKGDKSRIGRLLLDQERFDQLTEFAFDTLDLNHDGELDVRELRNVVGLLRQWEECGNDVSDAETIERWIHEVDKIDVNKVVNLLEFRRAYRSHLEHLVQNGRGDEGTDVFQVGAAYKRRVAYSCYYSDEQSHHGDEAHPIVVGVETDGADAGASHPGADSGTRHTGGASGGGHSDDDDYGRGVAMDRDDYARHSVGDVGADRCYIDVPPGLTGGAGSQSYTSSLS